MRYEVIEGREGGMGRVWLCRDRTTGQPVALKTFKPEMLHRPAARARFLAEATNWIFLGAHPNIVLAHRIELIGDPALPYLVLDWIVAPPGHRDATLTAIFRPGRALPFGRSLGYALDVARAMRHAESRIPGIVHRDLKPGNMLLDATGCLRLTDFGLAIVGEEARGETAMDSSDEDAIRSRPNGTPPYAAPEAWMRTARVDCRSDIYSLGCVLQHLITGLPAASGTTRQEIRRAHLDGKLVALPPEVPDAVQALIRDCTAREPEDRVSDWAEVERRIADAYRDVCHEDPPPLRGTGAGASDDMLSHARTYRAAGRSYFEIGRPGPARACARRALEIAQEQQNIELQYAATLDLATVELHCGNLTVAQDLLVGALAMGDPGDPKLEARSLLGSVLTLRGAYREAIVVLEGALAQARGGGEPRDEIQVLGNLANAYGEQGDVHRTIHTNRRLLRLARTHQDSAAELRALANLGVALRERGRPGRAAACLRRSEVLARTVGDLAGELFALQHLCEALIQQKGGATLRATVTRYCDLARDYGDARHCEAAEAMLGRAVAMAAKEGAGAQVAPVAPGSSPAATGKT